MTALPARAQVDVVAGDVRDRNSLTPAVAGTRVVVSAVHGFAGPGRVTPASVDRDGNANLVDAARAAGAAVVLMSVVGASAEHPMDLFRMKAAAEDNLRRSGIPWTIVRSTAFAELYVDLTRQTAGRSGRPLVFGRGENPINFVSVEEVAAAVESAVKNDGFRGRVLEIGGPRNMTLNEIAGLAQQQLGSSGRRPRHVPRLVLRALAAKGRLAPSTVARQAQAALIMDTTDMTFHAEPLDLSLPGSTSAPHAGLQGRASPWQTASTLLPSRSRMNTP